MHDPLKICNLTFKYGNDEVLSSVNASFPAGTMTAIVGPNGAGKSTLMKSLIGIVKPVSGSIEFFGGSFKNNHGRIAYVPQTIHVDSFFPMRVKDVIAQGMHNELRWYKLMSKDQHQKVIDALGQINMEEFANHQFSELSGGQFRRMFVARALIQNPDLFLLDEPFNGVDVATHDILMDIFRNLVNNGKTVVMVHHDLTTLRGCFDRVVMLNKTIVAEGPVDDILTSENISRTYNAKFE